MAGLATQGFALSDLPRSPVFPSNIGKFSTQEANDTAESSLKLGQNLVREIARYKADQAALAAQKATSEQTSSLAAPDIVQAQRGNALAGLSAQTAQANVLAQENNSDVAAIKGKGATAGASNALSQTNLDAQELALLKTLTPEQYAAYKQVHGFGKISSQTSTRDPGTGAIKETSAQGVEVPGKPTVVTDQSTVTGAAPFALPNNMGTLIDTGKGQVGIHAPPAVLNNVTGTEPQFLGTSVDANGVQQDEYVINEYNAQGGVRPGTKFKQVHGLPPPQATGSRAFAQPGASPQGAPQPGATPAPNAGQILGAATTQAVGGKMNAELAAKNKMEALNDLAASEESTSAMLANIEHAQRAITEYNDGLHVPNAVRGKFGFLPQVQAVNAAKSQFVSDIMGKLRGAGRVTQQEVQYASGAYPSPDQAEAVQQSNIDYLKSIATAVAARRKFEFDSITAGMTPADAKVQAIQSFPIGAPQGFIAPANDAGAQGAAPAVAPAALSPQDQQAVSWAKANPTDPRAAEILKLHPGL